MLWQALSFLLFSGSSMVGGAVISVGWMRNLRV
jgi:hypothetical protein